MLIKRALNQIDCPSMIEPENLLDSEGIRPDGATAFPYKHGKCLTWDFTCVNTLKDTFIFACAKEAGRAGIGGEKKKDKHYEKLLRNYIFVPIAVETFGSWGPKGLKFIIPLYPGDDLGISRLTLDTLAACFFQIFIRRHIS